MRFLPVCIGILLAQPSSWSATEFSRKNLIEFQVEGHEPFKDIRSYLDLGIKTTRNDETVECEILSPTSKKAAKAPWVPLDFYTNILNEKEQKEQIAAGTLGELDVFFKGDDLNRNHGKDSYRWTRIVVDSFRGSLEFLKPKREKSQFTFLISFTRGPIVYEGLVRAKTWASEDHCAAAAFHCTQPSEDGLTCDPDGWSRKILAVSAEADKAGYLHDVFWRVTNEKEKTDVSAIYGTFQDLDSRGADMGEAYYEKLAWK